MSAPAKPRATSSINVAATATPMAMAVSASAVGGSFPPNATKVDAAPRSATVARSTRRSAITVPIALPNDCAPLCFSSQPRHELAGLTGEAFDKKKAELVANYENNFANPYVAAERGYLDAIILPEETRKRIYEYLRVLKDKQVERPERKHGNIQL